QILGRGMRGAARGADGGAGVAPEASRGAGAPLGCGREPPQSERRARGGRQAKARGPGARTSPLPRLFVGAASRAAARQLRVVWLPLRSGEGQGLQVTGQTYRLKARIAAGELAETFQAVRGESEPVVIKLFQSGTTDPR